MITNMLTNAHLLYRTAVEDSMARKVQLMRRFCDVYYFNTEPLQSYEIVICSLLLSSHNKCLSKKELGVKLGFNIDNQPQNNIYFDKAEYNIFNKILTDLTSKHLIDKECTNFKLEDCDEDFEFNYEEDNEEFDVEKSCACNSAEQNDLYLTEYGEYCLQHGKRYNFYIARNVEYVDFMFLKGEDGTSVKEYPFAKELGIHTQLNESINISPPANFKEILSNTNLPDEVKNINLQLKEEYNIYNVKLKDYLPSTIVNIDVELWDNKGFLFPLLYCNDNVCRELSNLYLLEVNSKELAKKVEQAMYYRLLNNQDITLTYKELEPYSSILELDRIIQDSRTDWDDQELLAFIIDNCSGNDWMLLSKCCDINVLKSLLKDYKTNLDWVIITERIEQQFISLNSKIYPWSRDVLLAKESVDSSLIEQLIEEYEFYNGEDDGEWNWDLVIDKVSNDFIERHIDDIPFNLSILTERIDASAYHLILEHKAAKWNWNYIGEQYPINFIVDNFDLLYENLSIEKILIRLFSNENSINYVCNSQKLLLTFQDKMTKEQKDSLCIKSLELKWTDCVIDFCEQAGLITWGGDNEYMKGFEQNPSLVWDTRFFAKYSHKIITHQGAVYISKNITNPSIVCQYPEFAWDKKGLSVNNAVINDANFVLNNIALFDAETILQACNVDLLESYFEPFQADALLLNSYIRERYEQNVSVDFLRKHIRCEWNWKFLTRRIYSNINVANLGMPLWIDKWDWSFLTCQLPIDTIMQYALSYSRKWDWHLLVDRLSPQQIGDDSIIQILASVLEDHSESSIIWHMITCKCNTSSLIDLVNKYKSNPSFCWDYTELYAREDFYLKDYLKTHIEDVDWNVLSESQAVNKWFTQKEYGHKKKIWDEIFISNLNNESYHWNFYKLTRLENIIRNPKLFMLSKDWDWDYISENASWINLTKGKDLYFHKYKDKLSFDILSAREDIGLSQSMVIECGVDKWNWHKLVNNPSVIFQISYVYENQSIPWNWATLSNHKELTMEWLDKMFDKPWDWSIITQRSFFEPSVDVIKRINDIGGAINWKAISGNDKLTIDFFKNFADKIDWSTAIRKSKAFITIATENLDFLEDYDKYIDWSLLNQKMGTQVPLVFLSRFTKKINWRNASASQTFQFSIELLKKFEHYWYWNILQNNPKLINELPYFEEYFSNKIKVVKFVDNLKKVCHTTPKIYHFSHLYNAIDIIKSRKILSRNKAKQLGLLKGDSAGAVVERSHMAHPFARFYFRPKTPTQYYNEALGADSMLGEWNKNGEWKSKYPQARNLGLPKCPIPVFFCFDIEEVLAKFEEHCFYSDRNMQSDCPNVYKISDCPNYLNTTYLFYTADEAYCDAKRNGGYDREIHLSALGKMKRYSQQEFLIEDEFDFTDLESTQIICYDESYVKILKDLLGDDPICKKISVNDRHKMFMFENRSLAISRKWDKWSITSNFEDSHYYLVKSKDIKALPLKWNNNVSVINKTTARVNKEVCWYSTDIPFEIYFVDPDSYARNHEWLVYTQGENDSDGRVEVSEILNTAIQTFEEMIGQLPIELTSKLFLPQMLYSYHGIAHTCRVLFNTHILVTFLSEEITNEERIACYMSAILHDTGKKSDCEGSSHGYSSRYKWEREVRSMLPKEIAERVLNAIQYHSVEDQHCPPIVQADIIWQVLKDSDALDRSRFGRGCNIAYLRLPLFLSNSNDRDEVLRIAQALPAWTQDCKWNRPCNDLINAIKSNVIIK